MGIKYERIEFDNKGYALMKCSESEYIFKRDDILIIEQGTAIEGDYILSKEGTVKRYSSGNEYIGIIVGFSRGENLTRLKK